MILHYRIEYLDGERNVVKYDLYAAHTRREAHRHARNRIPFLEKQHPRIAGYRVMQMVEQDGP